MAFERLQTSGRAYLDAGGEPLTDERREGSVTKILPWRVQPEVLRDFDDFKCADEPLIWIKTNTRLETSMAPTSNVGAHAMGELGGAGQHELQALGDGASEDEVNAIYRRFVGRGAQRGGRPAGTPSGPWPKREPRADKAPPRSAADSSCPNCLEKGHTGDQCTKPKIDISERKCFLCKKTGQSARHCKEKPKSLNNVENAPRVPLAMMDCDGFIPIQRRNTTTTITPGQRPTRSQPANNIDGKKDFVKESMNSDAKLRGTPMPRQPVLGDYLSKNTFAALEEGIERQAAWGTPRAVGPRAVCSLDAESLPADLPRKRRWSRGVGSQDYYYST
jgi:hypothetical protein